MKISAKTPASSRETGKWASWRDSIIEGFDQHASGVLPAETPARAVPEITPSVKLWTVL